MSNFSQTEWVKNVTLWTHFNGAGTGAAEITLNMPSLPNPTADEMIVRGITFNGSAGDPNCYLLWSSTPGEFIGSFAGVSVFTSSPHSVFRLNSPVANSIQFKLYKTQAAGQATPAIDVTGDLVIHLEFRKYHRNV